ncbi:MAG: hypothetical protein PHF84_12305, partial [bacterium]|nr:hypothetical protein [bacterium]
MKKIILLFLFILLVSMGYGQLTNTSYYQWSVNYSGTISSFSNQASLVTNFYKFLVTYNNFYQDLDISRVNTVNNVFPGTTLDLPHYIYNVGGLDELAGINVRTGSIPAGINISILDTAYAPLTNTP